VEVIWLKTLAEKLLVSGVVNFQIVSFPYGNAEDFCQRGNAVFKNSEETLFL
jgi:hypothetical protein